MEEKKIPDGWSRVQRDRILFDEGGRMKILGECKCGSPVWIKQGKVFKRFLRGRCPSCGALVFARIRKVSVSLNEAAEDEGRIRDVDAIVAHLTDVAVREIDPVMYDAAEMLQELSDKHWSECWQIGEYSDENELLFRVMAKHSDRLRIHRTEEEHPAINETVLVWTGLDWTTAMLVKEDGCYMWAFDKNEDGFDYVGADDWEYWMPLPGGPRKGESNE